MSHSCSFRGHIVFLVMLLFTWMSPVRSFVVGQFGNRSRRRSQRLFQAALSSWSDLFSSSSSSSSSDANNNNHSNNALMKRVTALYPAGPTAVQTAAWKAILKGTDVTMGAETGSGKTLAYLLPLLHSCCCIHNNNYSYARALILVPNKDLVAQVVRMAEPFVSNTDIQLAVVPGGLAAPEDFGPFRRRGEKNSANLLLLVSTPAALGQWAHSPKNVDFFADIDTVVFDEADMLLDGGYLRAMSDVLMGFRRADRMARKWSDLEEQQQQQQESRHASTQHVFVAATLPNSGLRSVDAYLQKRFPQATRVTLDTMHRARHTGLDRETKWIPALETKRERLQHFVELYQSELGNEKIMIFVNASPDADAVTEALQREGIRALAYHAKTPDRAAVLDQFRRQGDSNDDSPRSVLVCTDLASRGLDIPGVTCVVQLQFAGNVVSHLHRMGRCGRLGDAEAATGRGIVYYGASEEALVKVVQQAEKDQQHSDTSLVLKQDVADDAAFMQDGNAEQTTEPQPSGSVYKAFSRKRGFTKKIKKERRREREEQEQQQPIGPRED